jgi:hypothetical protein
MLSCIGIPTTIDTPHLTLPVMTFCTLVTNLAFMPKVNIDVPSKYSAQETFEKIKKFFESPGELKKFDSDIACTFNDAQMSGTAKGSKFSADMKVSQTGDAAGVSVVLDLPFLLTPLKGQIKSTVEKKLGALLS